MPGCSCCGEPPVTCGVSDGKPRTDPKDEGTWVPSGTWPSVTWTFVPNPGDESGETWFFYGSFGTSKPGGGATVAEQRDWGNLCNWYSSKTSTPSNYFVFGGSGLDKRATRLPPETAVVHVYSDINTTTVGPQVVKSVYFWSWRSLRDASEITTTAPAHDCTVGTIFVGDGDTDGGNLEGSVINGGARFLLYMLNSNSTVNGGAVFNNNSKNRGTVNGGAEFYDTARNAELGTVNGTGVFHDFSRNYGSSVAGQAAIVNDGAIFYDSSFNSSEIAVVNGGGSFYGTSYNGGDVFDGGFFYDSARNRMPGVVYGGGSFYGSSRNFQGGTVNGGGVFNDNSLNSTGATVNGGAVFNDNSENRLDLGAVIPIVNDGAAFNDNSKNGGDAWDGGIVNGGATFNGSSTNGAFGTVNGGATFNDAACSTRKAGSFTSVPCERKFVAHPTDIPVCNGSVPDGCNNVADTCGCG
jgi:hypothetical protein